MCHLPLWRLKNHFCPGLPWTLGCCKGLTLLCNHAASQWWGLLRCHCWNSRGTSHSWDLWWWDSLLLILLLLVLPALLGRQQQMAAELWGLLLQPLQVSLWHSSGQVSGLARKASEKPNTPRWFAAAEIDWNVDYIDHPDDWGASECGPAGCLFKCCCHSPLAGDSKSPTQPAIMLTYGRRSELCRLVLNTGRWQLNNNEQRNE